MAKSFLIGLTKIVFEELRKNQREKEKRAKAGQRKTPATPAKHNKPVIEYEVKSFENPSQCGINQGRISKLTIKRNNKVIADYDRGWIVIPADKAANDIYRKLYQQYN